MMILPLTYVAAAAARFNLADFGAVGDNQTLCTHAFEAGVAAVAKAGGGTLVVPRGWFRTAPFNLTSHMTLWLEAGAVIIGPTPKQLGEGPAFPLWPVVAALPSYGQGRDHVGARRAALVGGVNLTNVTISSVP